MCVWGSLSTGWSRLEVSGGTVCRGQREGGGEREIGEREGEREREREREREEKTRQDKTREREKNK